jgi:hypothetical protein
MDLMRSLYFFFARVWVTIGARASQAEAKNHRKENGLIPA